MNYESILKDLKPSEEEVTAVNKTTDKVIDFINSKRTGQFELHK